MDDRTPPGERDVFNLLSSGPEDWVALHALDLAPANRGLRTEIDFVIIVPDTGILCVEVKSHEEISFDGLRWHPNSISRSPFKQASDGRYTFHRRLSKLLPQFRRVPVVHCCIFPRARFDLAPNLSVQPWELIDKRSFRLFDNGDAFCSSLKTNMEKSIAADEQLSSLEYSLPAAHVEKIVSNCVPIQTRRPDVREEIRNREHDIEKLLLEHQKPVLQLTELNERVIVSGPAGTGKTLIAMEVARRAAEQGARVALLCFNQLVGNWLGNEYQRVNPVLPNLIVGRTIQVLNDLAGIEIPENPTNEYWAIEWPDIIEDLLTDPDFKAEAKFDYFVIDEAQDILARPRLWECLAQFLVGGLENGKFVLFGDFDYQVLTDGKSLQRALAALNSYNRPVNWQLTDNCRNYEIVGSTAVQLAGFNGPVYTSYSRSGGELKNYDISFFESQQDQLAKIKQYLKDFKTQGYKASEITILSFRADRFSSAKQLQESGYNISPAWRASNSISFASVQAYKGLENKIIILTDVVLGDQDFHRDLFYTGMTRSTESVRVLCDRSSQKTLFEWLSGRSDV